VSGVVGHPLPAQGHGLRRFGAAAVIVAPLMVGLLAAIVLGVLQSHERTASNTRLVLAQLHEEVLLQQEILSHAQVMGYLTPDLPPEIAQLRKETTHNVARLKEVAGAGGAAAVAAAWHAYQVSEGRVAGSLSVRPTMGPMAATASGSGSSASMTGGSSTASTMGTATTSATHPAMPSTAGMGGKTGPPASAKSGTTSTTPSTPSTPSEPAAFTALVNTIDSASNQADDSIQSATTASQRGSVLTVSFEALILCLCFLWIGRIRHRALEASRAALEASEARFRSLVQNASDVVMVLSPDRRIDYVTPSILSLLGHTAAEVVRRPLTQLVNRQDKPMLLAFLDDAANEETAASQSIEFRLRHVDGRWVHVEGLATNPREDDADLGLILTMRDITERKAFEEQLAHQAFHDALTGLPNRALFHDRLGHALTRRSENANTAAVLFIDLDDFKTVNDSLGHEAGDEVLTEVAARLRESLRSSDTPARLGGDEFAVLLEGISDVGEAVETGRRIVAALGRPLQLRGREITTSACIGISIGLPQISEADELLRDADTAMYAAKARGRGNIEVFAEVMHSEVADRLALMTDLEDALARDEFVVYYQPTVSLTTNQITGFEALVRLQHPERGLVAPMEFIPLAEETGLIVPLGRWVLGEACLQAQRWRGRLPGNQPMAMSVNLSVKQLETAEFVADVQDALARSGLEPSCLILEITEGVLLRETAEIAARLLELKELGVRLAIDDFGTGYSSLGYLQTLPLDILKIDKRFVDDVAAGSNNAALASAIIAIGRALGMQTVAEGIEREEQVSTLRRLHCQIGQGYMFARPLDPQGIEDLLDGTDLGRPEDVPTPVERSAVAAEQASIPKPRPAARTSPAEIRTWARANGMAVSDRGPIPARALDAYAEAHS
jgi:diguanylate cyclase (GGDEF)-like protein/PAS domain S-box-containing protein